MKAWAPAGPARTATLPLPPSFLAVQLAMSDPTLISLTETWRTWLLQAEQIPGWHDGPDYAPHPVVMRPLEADEPE